MRLLPVWVLAVAGWVAAAAPGLRSDEVQQGEDLGPALRELARRKRANTKANLPYSNYRPVAGIHRYRYPLYRKRSYPPQQYDYEDDIMLPEVQGTEYSDYEDYSPRPSLFRERNLQQQERKKKELLLEDDGYFTDDYIPDKGVLSPNRVPLRKKDYLYHLYNMPYSDLERLNYMYEIGKRDSDLVSPYDLEALDQIHGVGRKTVIPSSTEQFYNAIDSIRKKKAISGGINPSTAGNAEGTTDHLQKLRNFLASAAGRYLEQQEEAAASASSDPMIRRKRDTTSTATIPVATTKTNSSSSSSFSPSSTQPKPSRSIPTRYLAQMASDRKKRDFSDYFKWEKKSSDDSKEVYDFLTQEYFKSIARSVGQKKKKRMAYAQFEADKRSYGIEEFLESPSMLQYMQTKLREMEEEVAKEAQEELKAGASDGDTHNLIDKIVVRLDALERMREALSQLEQLFEEEQEDHDQRKRGGAGGQGARKRVPAPRKRALQGPRRKAASQESVRREGDLPEIFLGNTKEECPVLERILLNCVGVSDMVADRDRAFLHACLRHEVCYMCGSGLGVSGHECDAILSSSLEAACSRNLDCLSAAGDTFELLSDADRYDGEGTCTHDPCVRQLLESR